MDHIKAKLATNKLQECLKNWKRKILWNIKEKDIVITAGKDYHKLRILEHLCIEGADLKHLERQRGFGLIPNVFWCKKLIQFLIDRGADVNSRDENGDTALHLVIRHAHLDKYFHDDILNKTCPKNDRKQIIQFLVKECAADKSIANLRAETAFVTLLKTGLWLPEDVVDFELFWKVAEVAQNLANDRADFINACEPLLTGTENNRRLQCCRILIERGVEVNVGDFQDYPDLHNIYEFAKLVFNMGANVKSESARDYYDLSIYHYIHRPNGIRSYVSNSSTPPPSVFTYGATPTKQVEIFEMAGAAIILRQCNWNGGFEQWSKVVDTCREFNLQPTQEFLDNYEFLREDLNNPTKDEMFRRAMNTVCRLSPDRKSTFWNVLSNFPFGTDPFYIFDFLPATQLDSFVDFASTEEIDFVLLLEFVKCFDPWLEDCTRLMKIEREYGSWKNIENIVDTPERISQFHSIVNLGIACFDKLIHKTKCKKVSDFCIKLYLTLLQHLTSLHGLHLVVRECPPETEELFKGNELLLRKMINLDLRDGDWNTWVHLIFMSDAGGFNIYDYDEVTSTLFEDQFVDARVLKSKNRMGFEPAQLIDWKKCDPFSNYRYSSDVMCELGDMGAHFDARNCWNERTLSDVFKKVYKHRPNFAFKFDSLQCACARVLVRSLVPYGTEDGVPKFMVDFINSHEAWNSELEYREQLILKGVGS